MYRIYITLVLVIVLCMFYDLYHFVMCFMCGYLVV